MLMTHTHAKINIRALQFKKLEWKQIDGITFLANVLGKYGTHTHQFNGHLSRTTRVSRYQKGFSKTNLDFNEARDSEWQWHQLSHMKVCSSLQTDNHASNSSLCFYRPDALPAAEPTASKH